MQGGKRRDFSQTIPDERRDLSVRKAVHLLYGKKGQDEKFWVGERSSFLGFLEGLSLQKSLARERMWLIGIVVRLLPVLFLIFITLQTIITLFSNTLRCSKRFAGLKEFTALIAKVSR
jgi:hypothetical protein